MSYIGVVILECPECKAICTGHTISATPFKEQDWQDRRFAYYCFECEAVSQMQGNQTKTHFQGELSH
jgi:hypothetical protein